MTRLYPAMLVQAGIGGTVLVWLHLDENGGVIETRVKSGSGHNTLDEAALNVAHTARFSPRTIVTNACACGSSCPWCSAPGKLAAAHSVRRY